MFWETLWALVLGFGLSGAVQAFVSRNEMERLMGDHRPKTVARASLLGMASSSCSYAASAMAKSLFQKGADFLSSMVFMFASTNLVVELGVVLVILMGWQFAAAEFVGGPIMIVLLVAAGGVVLSRPMIEAARARVRTATPGAHEHGATDRVQQLPWREKLRSKGGWSGAASYTMADLTMLRKELVIGYAVAGFLAVLVPTTVWNAVFLHGHGALTSLENAIVGPFIAVISFVCSIGNVPMAAALWHGGISFGGVVSFVFADLIALPLVAIYRKLYGTPLTIRMFVLFYAVMAAAGLVVEGIFGAAGLIPKTRPSMIVATSFHWNYTTGLNFVFLLVFAALYWMYRNRDRFGAHERYSIDPVCGMQVEKANAPASLMFESRRVLFCSDRCKERFSSNPAKFASAPAGEHADHFMPH
jgi:uncharacterized membrane protein YraQ (UPF0718 family)/YHS domain-containing protein